MSGIGHDYDPPRARPSALLGTVLGQFLGVMFADVIMDAEKRRTWHVRTLASSGHRWIEPPHALEWRRRGSQDDAEQLERSFAHAASWRRA